jgi:hypothetical protein
MSVASHCSVEGIAKGSGQSWDKRGARKRTAAEAADAVKALKKVQGPATRLTAPTPKLKRGRKPADLSRLSLQLGRGAAAGRQLGTTSNLTATGLLPS